MAIAKLSIDLEARLANLQAGLDKAGLLAERQADRISKAFAGASRVVAAAGGALAAAFSVSVITQWVNRTVDGVDALNDLADATGSTVENLSALEDIAARTGTSMDTAGDAIVKMNKALADAKPGSDAARAFEALGLSVEELKRLDPVEAFQKLAVALQGFQNDANKARLVQELFGKSLKEVAPLLKDVAEAGTLQAKVTKAQADEAERFNKQIFEMQKNLQDLSRTLVGPLVSGFNAMAEGIRKVNDERAKGMGLWDAINTGLAKQFPQFAFGGSAETQAMLRNAAAAQKALADINNPANYSNEGRNAIRRLPDITNGGKTGSAKAPKVEKPDFVGPELSPALKDALRLIEDADENKLQRLRDQLAELASIAQAGGNVPDSAFAQLAEDIAKLDPAGQAAQKALDKLADDQKRLNDILADTPIGKQQAMLEQIRFINEQFAAGKIESAEQWAQAIQKATGTLDNGIEQAGEKGIDVARELGLTFSSAFEDAIVAGKGLQDVLKGIEQDILRVLSRKLVTEPLANAITGMLGGNTGSNALLSLGGSLLGSLFGGGAKVGGGFGGYGLPGSFGGLFADGGFLPPGKWGIAGERGPEPIFGGRTGMTVQPAGGVSVSNTFYLSGPVDMRTQQQVAAAAARSVERASRRNN